MTDRNVKITQDDSDNVPTIERVSHLNITVHSEGSSDQFARKGEEVKELEGTTPVFKRRVTGEIKKYLKGVEGAESKTIHEQVYFTGYDAFDVVEPPYNLEYLAKLYELSPHHYAAVNAKVANIVGLGYNLTESRLTKRNIEKVVDDDKKVKELRKKLAKHRDELYDKLESYNEEDSLSDTLIKVWRDYEVMGNGYIEIGRKKDNTIGYIGHVPAHTIRIRRKRDGFVQISGFKVQFFANFGYSNDPNPIGNDKPNEIIHLSKYSPTSTFYGIPDIISAKQAVAGNEFAARYNLDYFENKAIPRYAIVLKGARLGTQAESDLLSFFETNLKGQNHRSIYIPLPPDTADNKVELKFESIESGAQDSSFNNYRKANLADILMAHRVPVTKISVSDGASLAVARDADKTFKEQVCAPEQKMLEKKMSRIMKELTDAYDWELNEMSLTDENTQSQIDERRRKTGVETANEQRARRGEPSIEGGDELFDMNGKAKSTGETAGTTNRQRDSVRSAGATDSAGEARNPKGEGRTVS